MVQIGAINGNRLNSSGNFADTSVRGKSTVQITQTVLAGGHLQVPASGNSFYISSITTGGTLEIQPNGASRLTYALGQGLALPFVNAFDNLQIKNPGVASVTFTLVVGFDEFIDKTFVINAGSIASIAPYKGTLATFLNTTVGLTTLVSGASFISLYNAGAAYATVTCASSGPALLQPGQVFTMPAIAEGVYESFDIDATGTTVNYEAIYKT